MTTAVEPQQTTEPVTDVVARARKHLLALQKDDGHWCGELEGDTIVESEYLLALHVIGRGHEAKARKAAEFIRRQQLEGGGWGVYPGGPAEVSASVKAYFVLKLAGDDPDSAGMKKARRVIRTLGGIDACNSFTKIYLAVFGQFEWRKCPAVPPEITLLPDRFPLSIYQMSSWSRAIVVPLSIIWAMKPVVAIPASRAIEELRVPRGRSGRRPNPTVKGRVWALFFSVLDRVLIGFERVGFHPLRRKALHKAESFVLDHLRGSDGLGALLPPIINTIFALHCLGYPLEDPVLQGQVRELEKLEIEEQDTLRIQPCFSPVWDTAIAMQALIETGTPSDHPALQKGARWLLGKQCQRVGDYAHRNPVAGAGGWYFEYRNEFYPDCDDTAAVLTTLSRVPLVTTDDATRQQALSRGLRWQLSMQNPDGGWGAFDRGCNNAVLTFVPFADHNAMIDPSCEDLTGRTLEALHHMGVSRDHPAVESARAFLTSRRNSDGTWYGRWGVNYLYGTWLALRGLELGNGESPSDGASAAWLYSRQNADGGWGELPRSYDEPRDKGRGPSTPSQTSWALMALFALGHTDTRGVLSGIEHLLRSQRADGSWKDSHWTGTGFPKVFYLRYHLYAVYFPLLALGIYQQKR